MYNIFFQVAIMQSSVLNQSGDEAAECPLCMEPLEVDDLNFFPCTCGYQVCKSKFLEMHQAKDTIS